MSRMLDLLNKLKTQAKSTWLTDSQKVAFDTICETLRFPETINLYGPVGSGKTFLAWTLSRSLGIPYFPSAAAFENRSRRLTPRAIVDNVIASRRAVRNLLAVAQRKGTDTMLFVTLRPSEVGFQAIALPAPTSRDLDVVYHNLSLLEYYALPPVQEGNLWDVVRSVL